MLIFPGGAGRNLFSDPHGANIPHRPRNRARIWGASWGRTQEAVHTHGSASNRTVQLGPGTEPSKLKETRQWEEKQLWTGWKKAINSKNKLVERRKQTTEGIHICCSKQSSAVSPELNQAHVDPQTESSNCQLKTAQMLKTPSRTLRREHLLSYLRRGFLGEIGPG